MSAADDAASTLARVVGQLPGGGEARPGQVEMTRAVADTIAGTGQGRHLAVQAGTGTGKTLAYLVPTLLSGKKAVVATATKALQGQLAGKDLPFLQAQLPEHVEWAVLKGRANYLCLQRLAEITATDHGGDQQLGLDGVAERAPADELAALARWAETTDSGDRAELDVEPSPQAWAAVSVSARECPGASRCPRGAVCFAEGARLAAAEADVVVVNLHLYGLDLASGGVILPEHEVVVIDEAHQLEEIVSATSGVDLTGGRFTDLARRTRGVIDDDQIAAGVDDAGRLLTATLRPHRDRRLRGVPDDLAGVLAVARGRVEQALAAARRVPADAPEESRSRVLRIQQSASALLEDLEAVELVTSDQVMWVEGTDANPVLRVAPVDVSGVLRDGLWSRRTAVLTSATLPAHLPERLGLDHDQVTELDVGSPFDYQSNALLYCAAHLPDPRRPAHLEAMVEELAGLIEAAGGRTLGLFTSFRVLDAAAEAVAERLDVEILTQRSLPKARLIERFTREEETCLFATMGFWQGVDVPGRALSLVAIDRIPFGRPDEPLLQARRERAGPAAFGLIDLPRATTLLAQGAGRLIRSATDTGVVAVLDPRLASAGYRWEVVNALPPMRRSKDPAEVRRILEAIRDRGSASRRR